MLYNINTLAGCPNKPDSGNSLFVFTYSPRGIRTLTNMVLNHMPLPLGYRANFYGRSENRTHERVLVASRFQVGVLVHAGLLPNTSLGGFEPPPTEPNSAVQPLHQREMKLFTGAARVGTSFKITSTVHYDHYTLFYSYRPCK